MNSITVTVMTGTKPQHIYYFCVQLESISNEKVPFYHIFVDYKINCPH